MNCLVKMEMPSRMTPAMPRRQWLGCRLRSVLMGQVDGEGRGGAADEGHGAFGALSDEERALGLVLEVVPDPAVAIDAKGIIIRVNRGIEALFGHRSADLLGRPIEVLVPERFRHAHRRHREGSFRDAKRRSMGTGIQLYGRRTDAREFPIDISLAPVPGSDPALVVAAIRDVSARQEAAQAMAQLAAIVSSSRDGIITITPTGLVTSWNRGAEQILGTPSEEALGSHVGRWIPEIETAVLEELMGVIMAGGSPSPKDTEWWTPDGKPVQVAISMSPMHDEQIELRGFSILIRDIADRKAVEVARQRQERWQAVNSQIRTASFTGVPLTEFLQLACEKVTELVEGQGAAILRGDTDMTVDAGAGRWRAEVAEELTVTVLGNGRMTRSSWDPSLPASGSPFAAIGVPIPTDDRRALVVFVPPDNAADEWTGQVVEGIAGQVAIGLQLAEGAGGPRTGVARRGPPPNRPRPPRPGYPAPIRYRYEPSDHPPTRHQPRRRSASGRVDRRAGRHHPRDPDEHLCPRRSGEPNGWATQPAAPDCHQRQQHPGLPAIAPVRRASRPHGEGAAGSCRGRSLRARLQRRPPCRCLIAFRPGGGHRRIFHHHTGQWKRAG